MAADRKRKSTPTGKRSIRRKWSAKQGREVFGYDAEVEGRRVRVYGFSSPEAAQVALAKRRALAFDRRHGAAPPEEERGAPAAVTVAQLVERRCRQLRAEGREKAARVVEGWLKTLPAGLAVAELKTSHLSSYADARLSRVRPQTVFRELTDVCSALNRARDLFPSLEDWRPPRRPRMKVPSGRRERVITGEEAAALFRELRRPREAGETARYHRLRHDAADLLQIALQTGARRGEILGLRRADINFEWKTLRITGTKTDRVRVLPMGDSLVALFRRRLAEIGPSSPRLFPLMDCRSMIKSETGLIYEEASRRAGIPYGRETPSGWVLHDARHTAITAMLHAGNSIESVMAISGHSARVMALRYAHSNERTKRAAVSALDQFAPPEVSAFVPSPGETDVTGVKDVKGRRHKKAGKTEGKSKRAGKTRAA